MVARNMQSHWQNADVQNAKALAILEVKDVVIASLEEELKKAEVEVEHYEEIAEQTKARAAMAESTQIQATRSELATLKDGGGNFTDSDCEALSEMAMQAERRTQEAENDVVKLQAESQEAEQRVEHLTKQLAAKQLELPGRQFKAQIKMFLCILYIILHKYIKLYIYYIVDRRWILDVPVNPRWYMTILLQIPRPEAKIVRVQKFRT